MTPTCVWPKCLAWAWNRPSRSWPKSEPPPRALRLRTAWPVGRGSVPAARRRRVSYSTRSPKGNKHFRRVLVQAAHATSKTKGSYLQTLFHRLLPRQSHLGFGPSPLPSFGSSSRRVCGTSKKASSPTQELASIWPTNSLALSKRLGFQIQICEPAP